MQFETDPMVFRAEKTVLMSRRGSYGSLELRQATRVVCEAIYIAFLTRDRSMSVQAQEGHLTFVGHLALATAIAGSEDRAALVRAIEHLPVEQQHVLSLRYVEAMSYTDISSVLELSEPEVRALLILALSALVPK